MTDNLSHSEYHYTPSREHLSMGLGFSQTEYQKYYANGEALHTIVQAYGIDFTKQYK